MARLLVAHKKNEYSRMSREAARQGTVVLRISQLGSYGIIHEGFDATQRGGVDAALPGLVVHGGQEVEELDEAVGLDEPRHEGVGLRPQRDLEAVEAPRALPVLLKVETELEAGEASDLGDVKVRVVAEAGVVAEAALLAAVDLPLFLLGQAEHGGLVRGRQVQLLL